MTTSAGSRRCRRLGIDAWPTPIDVAAVTSVWPVARSNRGASSRYAAVKAPDVMTVTSPAAAGAADASAAIRQDAAT